MNNIGLYLKRNIDQLLFMNTHVQNAVVVSWAVYTWPFNYYIAYIKLLKKRTIF